MFLSDQNMYEFSFFHIILNLIKIDSIPLYI